MPENAEQIEKASKGIPYVAAPQKTYTSNKRLNLQMMKPIGMILLLPKTNHEQLSTKDQVKRPATRRLLPKPTKTSRPRTNQIPVLRQQRSAPTTHRSPANKQRRSHPKSTYKPTSRKKPTMTMLIGVQVQQASRIRVTYFCRL